MDDKLYHGFKCEKFKFEDTIGFVVSPIVSSNSNNKIAFKTEYWDVFPELEVELLNRGFHIVHVKNETRFANRSNCDLKARFIKHISEKYELDRRCVLVGMSCGGAQAINFAAYYPELVSCLVIDAPVVNFLDFPGKYNKYESIWDSEFTKAYPNVKRSDIFTLKENPINNVGKLIEEKFPIIMLYGTEDMTVDYFSNGRLLEDAYSENKELLTIIPRNSQGHHPHGLIDKSDWLAELVMEKICQQK